MNKQNKTNSQVQKISWWLPKRREVGGWVKLKNKIKRDLQIKNLK